MVAVKFCFCLILHFVNLDLVISDDDLYKKFQQNDYKVDMEREGMSYMNKSYGEFSITSFKYNRTHFATNSTYLLNIDMDFDLEVIVQAYKFLSNEYRPFPMHFQYNFCKGLKYNFGGVKSCAEQCGHLTCPLKKNIRYFLCNCLFDESKLPPLMPSGRFKLSLEARYKNEMVSISEFYGHVYRPDVPAKRFG